MSESLVLTLPAELWIQIFLLASDEDVLNTPSPLPTALAPSAWYQNPFNREWHLRSPEEALESLQRRSYATKKSLALTCKYFYSISREACLLYRTLFCSNIGERLFIFINNLNTLAATLATSIQSPSLGSYTRRIHISSLNSLQAESPSSTDFDNAMVGILRHSGQNLETLVLRIPILQPSSFGRIAHAICAHSRRSLTVLQIHTASRNTSRLIWAISSLTQLRCLHIALRPTLTTSTESGVDHEEERDGVDDDDDEREEKLGSASSLPLVLPHLIQLSLSGSFSALLTAATAHWSLPSLHTLSIYTNSPTSSASPNTLPGNPASSPSSSLDIPAFLIAHGSSLVFLDIHTTSATPVPLHIILDLCPSLRVLSFNADLRYEPLQQQAPAAPSGPNADNVITTRQHPNMVCIGLHGLGSAFTSRSSLIADSDEDNDDADGGPGISTPPGGGLSRMDVHSTILRSRNDTVFSSILPPGPWKPFPNLRSIRVLSRDLLMKLEQNDGPSEGLGGGRERWERWFDACTNCVSGSVRLEDCTGALLGELPSSSDDEDESDDEEEEYVSDEEDEEEYDIDENGNPVLRPPPPEDAPPNERVAELRALLEECRAMEEEGKREEPLFGSMGMGMGGFGGNPMFGFGGGGGGFGGGSAGGFAAYYQNVKGQGQQ